MNAIKTAKYLGVCLTAGILCGCTQADKSVYEFHTASDAALIWRCNKVTGVAEVARYHEGSPMVWKAVFEVTTSPSTQSTN
jgi:hypothetical protein